MTAQPISNQAEWSILNGYRSKTTKDKTQFAEANTTIGKIDTLREQWQTTLDTISAHIETYSDNRPVIEQLQKEITTIEETIQGYVNKTQPLIQKEATVQKNIEKRILEDPIKAAKESNYKISSLSGLLKDLQAMGIPTEQVSQSNYVDFHQRTLQFNTARKKLNQTTTALLKVREKALEELDYLRSIRDNKGIPHYRPVYHFWRKRGYYRYRPFKMQENDNPAQQPKQAKEKAKEPELPALQIPPYQKKHTERTATQTAVNGIGMNIENVQNSLNQLLDDFKIAEASGVTEHIAIRDNDKADIINHEELLKGHNKIHERFTTNTYNYYLQKNKTAKQKKLDMPSRTYEIQFFAKMGYLTQEETENCYQVYNFALTQLRLSLETVGKSIGKVSPLLKTVPKRLTKLKKAKKNKAEHEQITD